MAPRLHLCVLSALVFLSGFKEPQSPNDLDIRISDYLFVFGNQFYFMANSQIEIEAMALWSGRVSEIRSMAFFDNCSVSLILKILPGNYKEEGFSQRPIPK